MRTINRELKDYIEQQILPIYENNDEDYPNVWIIFDIAIYNYY